MTKEITKAYILQQLEDKFQLRELTPERFAFSETVVPVYEIGQHLMRPKVKSVTGSVTAVGDYVFFVVPANEKWHLHAYNVIFVTGSYKVAGLMLTRPALSDYVYVDLTKNQAVSYAVNLPKDIILRPGEKIRVYVDEYTSTGDLLLIIDVTVETIR